MTDEDTSSEAESPDASSPIDASSEVVTPLDSAPATAAGTPIADGTDEVPQTADTSSATAATA